MTEKIRINFDRATKLLQLPHIGEKLAESIIRMRQEHVYLQTPEDLANLPGISLKTANEIADLIDWSSPLPEKNWVLTSGLLIASIIGMGLTLIYGVFLIIRASLPELILEPADSSPNIIALILNYGRDISSLLNQAIAILAILYWLFRIFMLSRQENPSADQWVKPIEDFLSLLLLSMSFTMGYSWSSVDGF